MPGGRSYSQRVIVYRTQSSVSRLRFHKSPECFQLRKGPSRGAKAEVEEVDLDDLPAFVSPCRTCFPDSPRTESFHRYCPECNTSSVRPCAHNGGVPVHVTHVRRKPSLLHEAGETYHRRIWVWPERVHHYITN